MASLNEIAFNIAENMNDTSDVLINRLKFTIIYYRAMMIRRDYARNLHLPESLLQEFVLETEVVPYHQQIEKHKVVRTKLKPPVPIRIKGPVFHYVGGVDRKTPYQFIYPEQMEYHNSNKWNCKPPAYSYIDGYITLHNIAATKLVVRSVFEDPRKVAEFEGAACVDDDADFPITMDMIEGITKGILSGEMQVRQPGADEADEIKI